MDSVAAKSLEERGYQTNYTKYDPSLYEAGPRVQKAEKVVAVLQDSLGPLDDIHLLDISSSTGIMASVFSEHVARVTGVDIDTQALRFAQIASRRANLAFCEMDGLHAAFADGTFDVVVCNQMYEHVPDAQALLDEIYRVLKPGGVCYFGANNRLMLIENHYGKLPFLSIIPKPLAHVYLRVLGRASFYYETHYTVWTLRKLVRRFDVTDYTGRIVEDPERFRAADMIRPGTASHRLARWWVALAYWSFPGYVWLLKKPGTASA
jgi:2-polyprenyl-3-methyl-5-hydroxy-6-metoxy-1,4-benzoquinol methylase